MVAHINITHLNNTTTDCLRFVTEFFEVISQSRAHIYHSALQLAPRSSVVWKLYHKQIISPVARVVTGIPASWDLCTATATTGVHCTVFSPSGQFIAVGLRDRIEIRDLNTLERVSVLKHPGDSSSSPKSLAFSPDGHLLASTW
jgi:WD40 repeat protein